MALFTKRAIFVYSFLNVIFLENNVIVIFALPNASQKEKKNVPFWTSYF